jgi:archaellum component FlaC
MNDDMLALEAELDYAYKLAKCERDGIIQDYERTLSEVRERLETLKRIYEDPNTDINTLCSAIEHTLQLLKIL